MVVGFKVQSLKLEVFRVMRSTALACLGLQAKCLQGFKTLAGLKV